MAQGKKPTKAQRMESVLQEMVDRREMTADEFFAKYPGYTPSDAIGALRYFTTKAQAAIRKE